MSYIIMSCAMVDTLKYTGEKAWKQFEMASVLLDVAIPQRLSNPCRARLSTLPSARGRGLWGRASTLRLLWGFPPIQLSFNAEPKIPSSSGTPLKVAIVHLLAWFYWRVALCSAEQGLLHGPEACFREARITGDKMWCKCLRVHCKSALLCYPFFLFSLKLITLLQICLVSMNTTRNHRQQSLWDLHLLSFVLLFCCNPAEGIFSFASKRWEEKSAVER